MRSEVLTLMSAGQDSRKHWWSQPSLPWGLSSQQRMTSAVVSLQLMTLIQSCYYEGLPLLSLRLLFSQSVSLAIALVHVTHHHLSSGLLLAVSSYCACILLWSSPLWLHLWSCFFPTPAPQCLSFACTILISPSLLITPFPLLSLLILLSLDWQMHWFPLSLEVDSTTFTEVAGQTLQQGVIGDLGHSPKLLGSQVRSDHSPQHTK
jgi:hypothetical protein